MSADAKTESTISIISDVARAEPTSILVVGCGTGHEAGILARRFKAATTGIDIGTEFTFDPQQAAPAILRTMDAMRLDFEDAAFDLIYSFHALEHIQDPRLALSEMSRVLRPGGAYFVGTPNKSRWLGYLNSAAPLIDKIRWNLSDIAMRARGKWSNEAGAHAGFTAPELLNMCRTAFGRADDVSDDYYTTLYRRKRQAVNLVARSGLRAALYPCVYVAGTRAP